MPCPSAIRSAPMRLASPTSDTYAGCTATEPIRTQTSTTTATASQVVGRSGTSGSRRRSAKKPNQSRRPSSHTSAAAVIATDHPGGRTLNQARRGPSPAPARTTRSRWSSRNGRRASKNGRMKRRQKAYQGQLMPYYFGLSGGLAARRRRPERDGGAATPAARRRPEQVRDGRDAPGATSGA